MREVREYKEIKVQPGSAILNMWHFDGGSTQTRPHQLAPYWFASLCVQRELLSRGQIQDVSVWLVGPRQQSAIFNPPPGRELISVSVAPELIRFGLGLRLDEIEGYRGRIDQDFPLLFSDISQIREDGERGASVTDIHAHLKRLVQKLHNQCVSKKSNKVNSIISGLRDKAPIPTLKCVSDVYDACPRWLHRQFKDVLGLSPKAYMRILRFNAVLEALDQAQDLSFADLAYQHSFSDQSHLNREFKAFMGQSPKQVLRARQHGLSDFSKFPADIEVIG